MIRLKGGDPVFSGSHRDCYIHPGDPTRCIKIDHGRSPSNHRGRVDRLIGRHTPNPNARELAEYRRLARRGVPLDRYFPRIHGMVETDLGPGLCFDFLRGSDGETAISLDDLIRGVERPGLEPELVISEIFAFAGFCIQHGIFASCDEPGNFGFLRDGSGYRLVAHDLKFRPNKELIPIATLFHRVRGRKIARRFARLLLSLDERKFPGVRAALKLRGCRP